MRCPRAQCRQVFEITDVDTAFDRGSVVISGGKINQPGGTRPVSDMVPMLPAEQAPAPKPPAGEPARPPSHVSDLLPMVQAEAVTPPPEAPKPSAAPSWREAPPVRGKDAPPPATPGRAPAEPPRQPRKAPPAPATPTTPATPREADWHSTVPETKPPQQADEKTARTSANGPVELPPGSWEAPPVRRGGGAGAGEEESPRTSEKGRRAKRLMIAIVVGAVVILGGAGGAAWYIVSQGEDQQRARAMKDYDQGAFLPAAERFRKMAKKFSDSSRSNEYRFMADLADMRAAVEDSRNDAPEALTLLDRFLDTCNSRPEDKELLEGRARDVGSSFVKRVETHLDQNANNDNLSQAGTLDQIEKVLGRLHQLLPGSIEKKESESMVGKIRSARDRIDLARRRKEALDVLRAMIPKASAEVIKEARAFIASKTGEIPGFDNDAADVLRQIVAAHRDNVRYEPAASIARTPRSANGEDVEPGILFDHRLKGRRRAELANQVVLALCRGVLYALDAADGHTLWAMRVGIDTGHLPVRLPPTAAHPRERLLVLSADTRTLFALDLAGNQLWKYRLDAPALGRPVLITRKGGTVAYLPTYDARGNGTVHEIGLGEGKLLGRFRLGQPLSVGGVHQKGTDLVYFPADDSCVYVLNVVTKKCEAILYTDHPAGTLRGEPLIVGGDEERGGKTPAYLMLSQASGLDATVLRLFQLPAAGARAVSMKQEPRIRGLTWATPYYDGEKLVFLSDAARLGLFGIQQVGNRDAPLFPLVPPAEPGHAGLDLTEFLGRPDDVRRGRSLVAHVQGDELWVLAHGRLQRLAISLNNAVGPRPMPLWEKPLELGSPLHGAQVREGPAGHTTLFLVTQPLKQPVCLVTAIDPEASDEATGADDRRILWQRQLGVVCEGQPLVADKQVLTTGQGGGLYRFDSGKYAARAEGQWQVGGRALTGGLDRDPSVAPLLLRGEGKTVYQVLCREGGTRLVLRTYDGDSGDVAEQEVDLKARLAGEVTLLGKWLVVPLATGLVEFYRLPLGEKATRRTGPSWRSRRVGSEARCFVVPVGAEEFLTTDGSRGLKRRRWFFNDRIKQWFHDTLPKSADPSPTVELSDRIVTAPLVLPRADKGPLRVLAADSRGVVTLLQGDTLQPVRKWELGGTVTAGPFLRGRHVGCVVDHTRLVCLDPEKDGKLWEYRTSGGAIVGRPVLTDGVLVVGDDGGTFVGLNPETGTRLGAGYRLRAAVAPAATPVPFGDNRAFAPLTDGTMLLLSLDLLRAPWWWRPLYAIP